MRLNGAMLQTYYGFNWNARTRCCSPRCGNTALHTESTSNFSTAFQKKLSLCIPVRSTGEWSSIVTRQTASNRSYFNRWKTDWQSGWPYCICYLADERSVINNIFRLKFFNMYRSALFPGTFDPITIGH